MQESKKSLVVLADEDGIMNFLSDFEAQNSDLKFELQMERLWKKYSNRKIDEKNKSIEVSQVYHNIVAYFYLAKESEQLGNFYMMTRNC